MSRVRSEPLAEQFPAKSRVSSVYKQMLELAREHLDDPWTCEITTWEDGEIEVSLWHTYGWPGTDYSLRGELRYHTKKDAVDAAIWKTGLYDSSEKTLIERWKINTNIREDPADRFPETTPS